MRNLEQIRAANAIDAANRYNFRGGNDGQVVKKVPAMIRENGALGALAFAIEKKDGNYDVWKAIIEHLASDGIHRLNAVITPEQFAPLLSETSAAALRDITDEALAYLNYLRRFAQ